MNVQTGVVVKTIKITIKRGITEITVKSDNKNVKAKMAVK